MIEIAIALGVIGFALVAIIGILPAGLNVQRETHQDTIIGQDGPFFVEAIRNGGPPGLVPNLYQSATPNIGPQLLIGSSSGLDFLTNYVEAITIVNTNTGKALIYTNSITPASGMYTLTNGAAILGLLSTPNYFGNLFVTARMRSLSGAATEQSGSNALVAFHYYMDVDIVPFNTCANQSLDGVNQFQNDLEKAYLQGSQFNQANLYDVRLKFRWPIKPNGVAGPGRQAYRSLLSGRFIAYTNNPENSFWFFQPSSYAMITTNL